MHRSPRLAVSAVMCALIAASQGGGNASAQTPPASDGESQMVDVGGHRLHVQVSGSAHAGPGRPTVVLDSGFGMLIDNWDAVVASLADEVQLVAYERASVGRSDHSDAVRTPEHVATEMRTMLRNLSIDPPYILVGHSIGAVYIRAFSVLYPEETAGLVYVDGTDFTMTPDLMRDPWRQLGLSEEKIDLIDRREKEYTDALFGGEERHPEIEHLSGLRDEGFGELSVLGETTDMPVIVLAGLYDPSTGISPFLAEMPELADVDLLELGRLVMEQRLTQQLKWVANSNRGRLIGSRETGHLIPTEDPEMVASGIRLALGPPVFNTRLLRRTLEAQGVEAAVKLFEEALADPANAHLDMNFLNGLAWEFFFLERQEDAMVLFQLNTRAFPDEPNAWTAVSSAYMTMGDHAAALAATNRTLELDPDDPYGRQMLPYIEAQMAADED